MEDMKLDDRMKMYEKATRTFIEPKDIIVIRLDGNKFSKFTKGFKKPFDDVLSKCMLEATKGIMEEFGCLTAYTQSDEMTFLLAPSYISDNNGKVIQNNQIFNGRVDKIASIFASKATLLFNKILLEEFQRISFLKSKSPLVKNEYDKYADMIEGKLFKAIFDGRAFGVPNEIEAFNALLFRMRDAEKNSKSMFTQVYSGHKATLNMNGDEKIQYCLENDGMDWNELRGGYKYGFLIKKEEYEMKVDKEKYPLSQEDVSIRSRLKVIEEKFGFSDENVELIMAKRV